MPLRSGGCHMCRRRKIRCDETRPSCRRCDTHGVTCPGYKTDKKGDVEFRHQTLQTVQRISNTTSSTPNPLPKHSPVNPPTSTSQPPHRRALARPPRDSTPTSHGTAAAPSSSSSSMPLHLSKLPEPAHPPPTLHFLPSVAVNRMRLYDSFLQFYLPRDLHSPERGLWTSNSDFISTLITLPSPRSSLSHALDALSLVQLGSIRNDQRMLRKAIEAYTKALRSLALALSKPESIHDDTVLATCCILSTCEFYTEFRIQGHTWISHQQGMQRLIEARGPQSILNSPLALNLFFQSTSSSLALSLLLRKQDPFTRPMWREVRAKVVMLWDDDNESYHFGLHLPSLLERHDKFDISQPDALRTLDILLADCENTEVDMKTQLAKVYEHAAMNERGWIALVDVDQFHPYAGLVTDKTMTSAYKFPTFSIAYVLSSHWLRTYLLKQVMQSLHVKRQQLVPGWSPAPDQEVTEREILCYIINLCRQIPYFVEPANSAIGEMCCFFPLLISNMYFRSRGYYRWSRWIHHISPRIFRKGMSMPFVAPVDGVAQYEHGSERDELELSFNWIECASAPVLPNANRIDSPNGTLWTVSNSGSNSTSPASASSSASPPKIC